MKSLSQLFDNNRNWAAQHTTVDPEFFQNLASQQRPNYLWIGCSDSRVPANQIVDLAPGDVFVHRNIANVITHTDFNSLSVIEYAVHVLQVEHIIVCGHYGCGGVQAASENHHLGLIDNWLRHIRDIRQRHGHALAQLEDDLQRFNRLCELNVIEQVRNVCHTTIVQDCWAQNRPLATHGWIYGIDNGILKDLHVTISNASQIDSAYRLATHI
ncbi:MAG: carbonate dehydratase [Planctomycetaceae bacterium]